VENLQNLAQVMQLLELPQLVGKTFAK